MTKGEKQTLVGIKTNKDRHPKTAPGPVLDIRRP